MSNPTVKLPSGYASVKYGGAPAGLTEAATTIGAAILKSFRYSNQLERNKLKGTTGFVAGFIDQKASVAGAGGTKFDTEKASIACLHGEHATKSWPVSGDVVTLSGMTGDDAKYNGDWSIVAENAEFAREQEADKGFDLERYCDVDLTP